MSKSSATSYTLYSYFALLLPPPPRLKALLTLRFVNAPASGVVYTRAPKSDGDLKMDGVRMLIDRTLVKRNELITELLSEYESPKTDETPWLSTPTLGVVSALVPPK